MAGLFFATASIILFFIWYAPHFLLPLREKPVIARRRPELVEGRYSEAI